MLLVCQAAGRRRIRIGGTWGLGFVVYVLSAGQLLTLRRPWGSTGLVLG